MENHNKENNFIADQKSKFVWTTGSDVQKVWRKYGWRPPSEYRKDFLFLRNRGRNSDN